MEQQTGSRLFALPAELRDMIYSFTLQPTIVESPPSFGIKLPTPGLLLSCKKAYQEALQHYYTELAFKFDGYDAAITWTRNTKRRLPKSFASRIVHVIIQMDCWNLSTSLKDANEKEVNDCYNTSFNKALGYRRVFQTDPEGFKVTIDRV